jgi:S1-C subfamily serine protease
MDESLYSPDGSCGYPAEGSLSESIHDRRDFGFSDDSGTSTFPAAHPHSSTSFGANGAQGAHATTQVPSFTSFPRHPHSGSALNSARSAASVGETSSGSTSVPIPWGAVMHFSVVSVLPNLQNPWKTETAKKWTGSGFYVGNKRILTNNHVIYFATSIRVERNGQPGNFPARVISKSPLCDLALVTVDDDTFWDGLPEIQFDDEIPFLGDSVLALGYPLNASTVTVTKGIVSSVEMQDLTLAGSNPILINCIIDAAINGGNSGGPVVNENTGKVRRQLCQLFGWNIGFDELLLFIGCWCGLRWSK